MNALDIILGGILLVAFFLGFRKGLVASLISFLRFFIAGYIAIYYVADVKPYMYWLGEQQEIVYQIAAFVLCFIAVSLVLWLVSKMLTSFVNFLALGVVNRLLGGLFSVLKYALLLSLVLFGLKIADKDKSWITEDQGEDSYLYDPIVSFAPGIMPLISEFMEASNSEDSDSRTAE